MSRGEGRAISVLFAATYPERTRALALHGSYAKRIRSDDYPWAPMWEQRLENAAEIERTWGENVELSTMIPHADPAMAAWFGRRGRASLSPAGARDLILMNSRPDVREVFPSVQCPTLVLHWTGDLDCPVEGGRHIAERVPDARFVELPGDAHVPWVDMDPLLDEVEEFLTGARPTPTSTRVLATMLFTDIVGSTDRLATVGDAAWASLLERHHATVRRELTAFGGVEADGRGQLSRTLRRPRSCDPVRARDPRRSPADRARRQGRACIRGRSSRARKDRAGSQSISRPAFSVSREPARFSSPRRRTTWSRAPGSRSRTVATTS